MQICFHAVSGCSGSFHRSIHFCHSGQQSTSLVLGLLESAVLPDFENVAYVDFRLKRAKMAEHGSILWELHCKHRCSCSWDCPQADAESGSLMWEGKVSTWAQEPRQGREAPRGHGPVWDPPVAPSSYWLTGWRGTQWKGEWYLNIRKFDIVDEISAGSITNLTLVHSRTRLC